MLEYIPRRRLVGGLRLPAHKDVSTAHPIGGPFIPTRLVVPVHGLTTNAASLSVGIGDRVRRGQTLASTETASPLPAVHAATSGRVSRIEERLTLSGGRLVSVPCVIIETDGRNEAAARDQTPAWPSRHSEQLETIKQAGIVGLGGAAFPTAQKIASVDECRAVVLNGAECEPYISCDDMLMRKSASEILDGGLILCDITGAELCIVAIETDKPEAIDAMVDAATRTLDDRLRVAQVQSIYPAGGERQLIELLTGIEIPSGRFASSIDYLCINVGTALAVSRRARHGESLISRVVTVTGDGVTAPQNVETLIGTPIEELIEFCGGYTPEVARLIVGGNMMGVALPDDSIGVTKSTNCVLAASQEEIKSETAEWPCIRCSECATACPAHLLPQELLRAARAKDNPALITLGLDDCIECGCCDVVCPSLIPLTQAFAAAKLGLSRYIERLAIASRAQDLVDRKSDRQQQEEELDRAQRTQLVSDLGETQDQRARAIAAAVERHRRRKSDLGGEN